MTEVALKNLVDELYKNGVLADVSELCTGSESGEPKKVLKTIIDLNFSEHDKVFEDRIAKKSELIDKLYKENMRLEEICMKKDADIYNLQFENRTLEKRIAELEKENLRLTESVLQKETKIHELESKETEKQTKINLNDRIKVKLTPLGAEIYYHQYDELNKKIKANGGTQLEPIIPEIDKDGYTEFTFHHFISLYGNHIGMCKPNVIEPLDIVFCE